MPVLIQQLVTASRFMLVCGMAFITACDGDSIPPGDVGRVIVTIDTLARFQTMSGWEATAQDAHSHPQFDEFKNSLFDQAVNDLGINRLRVQITPGMENPVDLAPSGEALAERCKRWLAINDNDNPQVINPAGFQFASLDSMVVRMLQPMKNRLEARGERLFVNLNYTAFLDQCPPPVYLHADPAEYAELILAVFLHMRDTFGFVPDAVETILEPDKVNAWSSGTLIGPTIAATGARLAAAGFHPQFVAPSTASLEAAIAYLDDIYSTPGVQPLLRELAYHRYGGASPEDLKELVRRAKAVGARTAMLEHIGSDVEDLYTDLTVGQASAWQQYTLAFPTTDNGAQYFTIVDGRPAVASRTRYLRQYFHYVRMGAQRIGSSGTPDFRSVAFQNVGGGLVVVIHADHEGGIELRGLRAGNYGISITTRNLTWAELGDRVVGPAGTLSFTAPAAGVITAYMK